MKNSLNTMTNIKCHLLPLVLGIGLLSVADSASANWLSKAKKTVTEGTKKTYEDAKKTVVDAGNATGGAVVVAQKTTDTLAAKQIVQSDTELHAVFKGAEKGGNIAGGAIVHGGERGIDSAKGEWKHTSQKLTNGVAKTEERIKKELDDAARKALIAAMKVWRDKMKPMTAGIAHSTQDFQKSVNGKAVMERFQASVKSGKFSSAQLSSDLALLRNGMGMGSNGENFMRLPHLAQEWTIGLGVYIEAAAKMPDIAIDDGIVIPTGMLALGAQFTLNFVMGTQGGLGISLCQGGLAGITSGAEGSAGILVSASPGAVKDAAGGYLGLTVAGGDGLGGIGDLTWPFDESTKVPNITQPIPSITLGVGAAAGVEGGFTGGYCEVVWKKPK